jgi:Ca-activated chloride channel family protein
MSNRIARCAAALAVAGSVAWVSHLRLGAQDGFRFRSGVELVNVAVTVTDRSGRFVAGLTPADFTVYDNEQSVEITHFSADRVPVSVGIVLDTSGSMAGDKIDRARTSIERFLDQLDDPEDEVFLYGFASDVRLIQEWTRPDTVSEGLRRVDAVGGTSMYDAVIEAVREAQDGRNRKKAVVVISDGNDTSSNRGLRDVRRVVQESEVLVYAIGIDGSGEPAIRTRPPTFPPTPIPFPFPIPNRWRPGARWSGLPQFPTIGRTTAGDRLNAQALRDITDDSGGRTEVVRSPRDLSPATASIADELSRQYSLGYTNPGNRDGRWHSIRVEVRDRSMQVRARRGYIAS